MAAIEVAGLHKSYGSFEAVAGIDLEVGAGDVVAFLGPNGAGKTTTVEILEGYRRPTKGAVRVLGMDPATAGRRLRKSVGIVLQEAGFPPDLTPAELMTAWRRLYDDPLPADEVLAAVGLSDRRDVRTKNLSGGEQRRLDLALGIVGQPEVLFLDEPTIGFDPAARRHAWELLAGLVRRGATVFLTTHYLEEAKVLADRIIIISAGRILAEGKPDEIGGAQRPPGTISFALPPGTSAADLPSLPQGAVVEVVNGAVSISTRELVAAAHALTGWAISRDVDLEGFEITRPSLEDTYLSIVGDNTR